VLVKRGVASANAFAYSSLLRRPARTSAGDEEGVDTRATPLKTDRLVKS